MLTGLWTLGVKVPDLEREMEFHRKMGNTLVLDETIEFEGQLFRIPLVKMGDKYMHLMEKTIYEKSLGETMPYGVTHLVYMTDNFEQDVATALASGAQEISPPTEVSGGFGDRRIAFFRSPSGWIFEIILITRNLVPEV